MTVDATVSEWLKSPELKRVSTDAAIVDAWGELALDGAISSPLALSGDAQDEADAQLDFLALPKAPETIRVPGQQAALLGQSRTITADRAGYQNGLVVFVIGVEELEDDNGTILTVIRRLA